MVVSYQRGQESGSFSFYKAEYLKSLKLSLKTYMILKVFSLCWMLKQASSNIQKCNSGSNRIETVVN